MSRSLPCFCTVSFVESIGPCVDCKVLDVGCKVVSVGCGEADDADVGWCLHIVHKLRYSIDRNSIWIRG
jgi:hypothetical protein